MLAWVRDRGEHYLLGPLLLAGIGVLTVDSLLFISLFQFLVRFGCDSFFLRLLWPVFVQASEVRFPLLGFFNLDSLHVVSTRVGVGSAGVGSAGVG